MRNLQIGEQRQFNRAADFGFFVGVATVSLGVFFGILISHLIQKFL